MKHALLCSAAILLLATACHKSGTTPDVTVDPPAAPDTSKLTFSSKQMGPTALAAYLGGSNAPIATISGAPSLDTFTYEIKGTLAHAGDTTIKGTGNTDNHGTAQISILNNGNIYNYKDGPIVITVKTKDTTLTDTATKEQYVVRNYQDILYMGWLKNPDSSDHYVQTQDIAFPDDEVFSQFVVNLPLVGSYDGQGHKITNVTFKQSPTDPVGAMGFFYSLSPGSVVKNVKLELSSKGATGNNAGLNFGALVLSADFASVLNCSVTGNINTSDSTFGHIGGLIAKCSNSKIIGCSYRGNITGDYIGGLIGMATNCDIDMCYGAYSFTATSAAGLIYAAISSGGYYTTISNSYAIVNGLSTKLPYYPISDPQYTVQITNCFANAGTSGNGLTVSADISDINAQLSTLTVANWPQGITPPADNKPYKQDTTANAPMKLWWE